MSIQYSPERWYAHRSDAKGFAMKISRWAAKEVRIAFEFDEPARASDSNQ